MKENTVTVCEIGCKCEQCCDMVLVRIATPGAVINAIDIMKAETSMAAPQIFGRAREIHIRIK
jgi:hypothetical protein